MMAFHCLNLDRGAGLGSTQIFTHIGDSLIGLLGFAVYVDLGRAESLNPVSPLYHACSECVHPVSE